MIWALYLLQNKKWVWAAILFGISISVKLLPLLLLPLFLPWFMAKKELSTRLNLARLIAFYLIVIGIVIITFMPFYSSEFLHNFSETIGLWFQNFEFNASIYYIIRWVGFKLVGWNVIGTVGKILPLLVIFFILGITFFRKNKTFTQLLTSMLFGVSVYFLLSTTVHPWYIATPLLLGIFTKYRFALVWSALVMLSYSAYSLEGFSENLWLVATEYSIVIGFFIWEVFRRKTIPNKK
jgi:Gpi18-like mannosyltransferase